MKILVSGLINIETNVNCHNFPVNYEPIVYAFNEVGQSVSGVAFNVLNGLTRLGDEVVPVSVTGKDLPGRMIDFELEKLVSETKYVRHELNETCTSVNLYDDGGRRKIFCDLKDIQDYVYPFEDVRKGVEECDALVLCNINFNDQIVKKVGRKSCSREKGGKTDGLKKRGRKKVFTDVHVLSSVEDEYNCRFLENADVVFLSDEKVPGNYEDFLISLWKRYGNEIIVLGMGEKGAMILVENGAGSENCDGISGVGRLSEKSDGISGGKKLSEKSDGISGGKWISENGAVYFVESVHVRPVVNTVGAGDALFSAFTHFYMKGDGSVEALKKAVTFASFKIGESGGAKGFCDEKTLEDLCRGLEFKVHEIKRF